MGMMNKKWGLLLLGVTLVLSGVLGVIAPLTYLSLLTVILIAQAVAGILIIIDK